MGAGGGAAAGGLNFLGFVKKFQEDRRVMRENEGNYRMEAEYTEMVGQRKLNLLRTEQDSVFDRQKAQLARSGINFDGSSLDMLAGSRADMMAERQAVQTDINIRKERLLHQAEQERAKMDTQDQWAVVDYGGSFLGGMSSYGGK